jgi:hypothetical protein
MKISMWILAKWLDKYSPRVDIQDGAATISGVRFIGGAQSEFPRDYVYIEHASEAFSDPNYSSAIVLAHSYDFIFVNNTNAEVLINEILAAIDFYNKWESGLWEASAHEDAAQKMIELSDDVFGHPSRIMDMDGHVIAISKKFGPDDVDERWKKTYETGVVQLSDIGTPVITMEGKFLPEWEEVPRRYCTEERGDAGERRVNYIAANIRADNENIAAFLMQEHRGRFTLAHCQLASVFCDILRTLFRRRESNILRSKPSILMDLLEGNIPDDKLSKRLSAGGVTPPLLLLSLRSIWDNPPQVRLGSMLTMIRALAIPSISAIHKEDVVCVINSSRLDVFIKELMQVINRQYYMIGISLPFEGWNDIPMRYRQAYFATGMSGRAAGIYNCRDFAFEHLIAAISNQNNSMELRHPALFTLELYDREQNTNFYETLYHYIANERSHAETSKAMGIHRNTLMYRIRRICELINSDLENPDERAFIYLSYKLNKDAAV